MEKLKLFIFIISLISVATAGEKVSENDFVNNLTVTASSDNNEGRIIDGEPTTPHELPYQLIIKVLKKYILCGAVLVSPGYALTAAHCMHHQRITKDYEVVAGAHSLKHGNEMEQSSVIKEVIMHPGYNRATLANDISILILTDHLKMTSAVQSINIPTPGYVAKGPALASGWGITEEGVRIPSDLLLKVNLTIWEGNNINKCDYLPRFDSNMMLCVGGDDGRGICSGDSGGPLVVTDGTGSKLLVGIVSGGLSCTAPAVFTQVSYYNDWINGYIGTANVLKFLDLHFLLFIVALQAYVQ